MPLPRPKPLSLLALLVFLAAGSACGACSNPAGPEPPPPPPPVVLPPAITCPADLSAATPTSTAIVNYSSPVVTNGTEPVSSACSKPSGTAFPLGTTDVTCTATDAIARSAQCTFRVTVTSSLRLIGTNILAFGDSITCCEVALPAAVIQVTDPTNSYPTVLESLLRARYTSQTPAVVNQGVAGESVLTGEDRLAGLLASLNPDALVLLEGANDVNAGRSLGVIADALRGDVRRSLQRGVKKVFLLTLLPQVDGRFRAFNPDAIEPINDLIREIADREGAVLVDAWAVFNPRKTTLIGDDGLHPTVEGHHVLAQTVFDAIVKNFEVPPVTSRFGP